MALAVGNEYPEVLHCVLFALALGAAIFFWGRGIRNVRTSDLIAGPAILAALCAVLLVLTGSSAAFGLIGELVAVFGIATVLLSPMARSGGAFSRGAVAAIGVGTVILGLCLLLIV